MEFYDLTTEDYDEMLVYLMVHGNKFFEDTDEESKDLCADAIFEATAKERRQALASAKPVVSAKEKADAANEKYKDAKDELKKSFKLQAGNVAFQSEEERNFRHKYDDEKENIVDNPFSNHKAHAKQEKEAAREAYWHKKKHAKEVMKTAKKMVRDKQNEDLKKLHKSTPPELKSSGRPVYEQALFENAEADERIKLFQEMFMDSRQAVSRAVDNFVLRLESGDSPDKEELLTYCKKVQQSDLYVEEAGKTYSIVPEKSVGQIKFGSPKTQVENMIKGDESVTADYDSSGRCILVEISGDTPVSLGGVKLMPSSQKQAVVAIQQKDKDAKVSDTGCTSTKLAIHLSFSGGSAGKVTKVAAGKKGYYD